MGRSQRVKEKPKGGTLRIFSRLMWTFARKYWVMMLIGVVSSFLIGGAMATGLRVMDVSFNVFEEGTMDRSGDGKKGLKPVSHLAPAEAPQDEATPPTATPPPKKEQAKVSRVFGRINQVLSWLGMDPIAPEKSLTLSTVTLLLAVIFLFFALQSLGELINRYSLKWLGARVVTDMRVELFNKLMHQSMGYFSRGEVGKLISRCTNDINAVEHVISSSFPELCVSPVFILVSAHFIYSKARELGMGMTVLMVFLALPVCVIPVYLLSILLKRYQKKVLAGISAVTSRMQECFSGIQVIKTYNQEEREHKTFSQVNEKFFKRLRKAILADVFVHPSMQLSAIGLAAIFVFVCYKYNVTLSSLAMLGFAAQQAYKPVKDLAKLNASLQKAAAAAERIFEVMDNDTSLPVPPNPTPINSFNDEIRFSAVDFAYAADAPLVLKGVDITIKKGEVVAIVGQTGSGKTTVASLLARFYDPTSGSITIDGVDLRQLAVADFRKMVGMVSQDTFLFNDTIAANIRYGRPEATDEEVAAAAKLANVTDFVQQWPEGFNHLVGERGNLLSGGQKQRVAIARAILRNPPILILDEATSALDTETERLVQEALNNVMRDRTVLAIAHRLSTIKSASQILVMDQGQIIEQGTHTQLLALNGRYHKLHDLQFNQG